MPNIRIPTSTGIELRHTPAMKGRRHRNLKHAVAMVLCGIAMWASMLCLSSNFDILATAKTSQTPEWHQSSFTSKFEESLQTPLRLLRKSHKSYPFIIQNNNLLCLKSHKHDIFHNHERSRIFAEMIHAGLQSNPRPRDDRFLLPINLIIFDNNGCQITLEGNTTDSFEAPRLSWCAPAPKFGGSDSCRSIPMPSFDLWKTVDSITEEAYWDSKFQKDSLEYPWSSKINMAVWRGTNTYSVEFDKFDANFSDIPRAKLVEKTREYPDLIDAAFTRIINEERFEPMEEIEPQTVMAERMAFDDQMKYKAILDIDGNSYSERLSKILCTNSVLIKIEPRWVEYFWDELKPMVHYVPASLDNLTDVVSYVMDKENEDKMETIVRSANAWCRSKNTRAAILFDTMKQLKKYEEEIKSLWESHENEQGWMALESKIARGDYQFEECWY